MRPAIFTLLLAAAATLAPTQGQRTRGQKVRQVKTATAETTTTITQVTEESTKDQESSQELDSELAVGKAINLFMRYGYLSICMRVVPRNDTDNWVFREPTVSVFRDINQYAMETRAAPRAPLFDGDFHMEFCDNLKQLLQAYFRDFSFERLERPWRAFTAGWPTETIARNLGINASFINGDNCYVLVRVSRYRETAKLKVLPATIQIEDVVSEAIDRMNDEDTPAIADFIRKYGSHYIASYTTGNSLYQVFVFGRQSYKYVKRRLKGLKAADLKSVSPAEMYGLFSPLNTLQIGKIKVFVFSRSIYTTIKDRLKTKGVSAVSSKELEGYFSPWHAKHIGLIKVASGNKTVDNWASKRLRVHYYIFSYPSLLKLHGEPALLKTVDGLLGNEALLQLSLKTLSPAFTEPNKKSRFHELIDNYLKLWETNM